jgi:hypothetical protein
MMKSFKLSLAAALLVGGLIGLVGCIWIPGSFQRIDGQPRPETTIGRAGSDKPLWVGRATREKVYAVLGKPEHVIGDRSLIYQYWIETGGIFFICGFGVPTTAERFLRVDFDDQGVLRAYKVFKDLASAKDTTL